MRRISWFTSMEAEGWEEQVNESPGFSKADQCSSATIRTEDDASPSKVCTEVMPYLTLYCIEQLVCSVVDVRYLPNTCFGSYALNPSFHELPSLHVSLSVGTRTPNKEVWERVKTITMTNDVRVTGHPRARRLIEIPEDSDTLSRWGSKMAELYRSIAQPGPGGPCK